MKYTRQQRHPARPRKRTRTRRHRRMRGGADYEIVDIREASAELLDEIRAHLQICWPGIDSVEPALRFVSTYKTDILYKRGSDGRIVFSRLIMQWPRNKILYIQKTCVSPEERNKGHYKNSLAFMRAHYSSKYPGVFDTIQNDVEYDTIGAIDHATRLLVFHKLGFRFNPIVDAAGEFDEDLHFILKSGEVVSIVEPVESGNTSFKYKVRTRTGEEKVIDLTDIDTCNSPIYEVKSAVVSGKSRKVVRSLESGFLTINPVTGAEEEVPFGRIEDTTYGRKGNPFDPENLNKTYCPLQMEL
jgi:hypothetical protein